MDSNEATANRDTLAKELYKRVFAFVVERVNSQIDYKGRSALGCCRVRVGLGWG